MRVTNLQVLKQLIFDGYVQSIDLGFTTGSDICGVMKDLVTGDIYVRHTEDSYFMYKSIDECKDTYKELGYQISYESDQL